MIADALPLAATVLVAGALKVLLDYQGSPRWEPALIDGGITALILLGTKLGVNGVTAGVRSAVSKTSN
jgi:hypothetical protein